MQDEIMQWSIHQTLETSQFAQLRILKKSNPGSWYRVPNFRFNRRCALETVYT